MSDNKNIPMTSLGLKIRQFCHETDTWKRSIEFIMQENAILKNRLAEVLNTTSNSDDIIDAAEQYQNRFVQADEYIWLIRKEIAELEQLLMWEVCSNDKILNEIIQKQKKLSGDMRNVVLEFNKMKFDFNYYLGGAL